MGIFAPPLNTFAQSLTNLKASPEKLRQIAKLTNQSGRFEKPDEVQLLKLRSTLPSDKSAFF